MVILNPQFVDETTPPNQVVFAVAVCESQIGVSDTWAGEDFTAHGVSEFHCGISDA